MELIVKSRNGKVSERYRRYVEEKLTRLQRYMDGIATVTVELGEEQNRGGARLHRAQVTLVADHGVLLRSDQRGPDEHAVIDSAADTLQRQIERYKDKHWRRGRMRRQGSEFVEVPLPDIPPADERQPRIVRTKEFQIKPMYSDEAVEQMELLGHNFFVFRDADTDKVTVLYRREDGNYGLIVADTA